MNMNKIIILSVILAVLGGGLWYRKQSHAPKDQNASLYQFAPNLDTSAVTDVEINKGNATVQLEKKDTWFIKTLHDAPASETSVQRLLEEIHNLTGELRSNDASILADYGLDDASALHLVLHQGGTERLHLLLGKGDFRNVFVRTKDSSAVYAVPGTILNLAGAQSPTMDGQFWIESNLLSLNLPDVRSVTVSTPDYEIHYAKKTAANATAEAMQTWDMNATRGKGPSEAQVKSALMTMTRTNVAAVLPQNDPRIAALDKPTHILTVETNNATQIVEAIRPDANQDAVARLKGSPFAYSMRGSIFERIFPSPARDSK